jgi:hypothetical protein
MLGGRCGENAGRKGTGEKGLQEKWSGEMPYVDKAWRNARAKRYGEKRHS